jgi:hypothetical protein
MENEKHWNWMYMRSHKDTQNKFLNYHVFYSISPRAHYSFFESDTGGDYLPEKRENTKLKDPHFVSTYIFTSSHLIVLHKNSLITSPQKSYCAPLMQPNTHADCQNIGIVAAKFPWSNDNRFYTLCSLWAYVIK